MKKKIIIFSILFIVVISAITIISYILSFKEVIFSLAPDVTTITIYKEKDYKNKSNPTKVVDKQVINLQTGTYIVIPSGNKISNDKISIFIKEDTTIKINPDYSKYYLLSILNTEKNNILNILKQKYPDLIKNYSIKQAELFKKGQWFGGLLVNNQSNPNNIKDIFRFIAYKESDIWKIVNFPDLILTKKIYNNVPIEILNAINKLEENF